MCGVINAQHSAAAAPVDFDTPPATASQLARSRTLCGVCTHVTTASLCCALLHTAAAVVQIRDSIKSLFPDRDCFTLVRPMHDERALNHLDSLDPSSLRPEFSEVCLCVCVFGGRLPYAP